MASKKAPPKKIRLSDLKVKKGGSAVRGGRRAVKV
jgi:hypothetical protein